MFSVVDLAASGRAEQDDELLVANLQLEIVDGNDVAGVPLGDRLETRSAPWRPPPLTLDRAGGEAGYDIALEHERENDRREHRNARRRH